MANISLMLGFAMRDMFKSRALFVLIVVSIAVATTAIIAINSILLGFSGMLNGGNRGWIGDIVMTPSDAYDQSIQNTEEVERTVLSSPHVVGIAFRSYAAASVKLKNSEKWVQPYRLIGIDVKKEAGVTNFKDRLIEGSFLEEDGPVDQVVIGVTLADFLEGSPYDGIRTHAGEQISVLAVSGEIKQYTIRGILDAKTFLPNLLLFIEKDKAENIFAAQKNNEAVILLDDIGQSIAVRDKLALRYPRITVHTSEQESGYVRDILSAVGFISSSINELLVFAVFLVINIVMYISVVQRKRQIGIMKSLGASNTFVIGAYLMQATCYALIAYSLGVVFYVFLYAYSSLHPIPMLIGDFQMVLNSSQMISSLIIVIIASIGGALIPAWIASRTLIIDVLSDRD